MSFFELLTRNRGELLGLTLEHLLLVAAATGGAVLVGVPIGVLLTRRPAWSRPVLAIANVLQTVPSLALFGFLIPVLGSYGIGRVPAIIALFLYSLLPILRNTFTGIMGVDAGIREAGRGIGMTDWQLLTQVELPLSLSVITAGVRVATVISIGTATIAAAIGAGGLGTYIFRGLRMNDTALILAGAVPAAVLALVADGLLGQLERALGGGASRARSVSRGALRPALAVIMVAAVVAVGLAARGSSGTADERAPVVVGSKDFTEQVIVGEIVAQLIEQRTGRRVERRFELGGDLAHRGLLSGEIDLYVEYTGTALMAILKEPPITDPRAVYDRVRREYQARFRADWLAPLGFNNTFAILVRGDDARRLGLRTVSDAASHAPKWRAAFGQDFISREDGYRGFARAYGLAFAAPPLEMDLSLTYRALAGNQVDLIAGNSTDGMIDKLNLVQLEDDKRFFPPYEAAVVIRQDSAARQPDVVAAIAELAGALGDKDMRRLNLAVDGEHRAPKDVAREFLAARAKR